MEEYKKGIGVSITSVRPIEDDGMFCKEVSLKIVAFSTFPIGDSVENGDSLCIFILNLERHIP